jgi:hypothetical protein
VGKDCNGFTFTVTVFVLEQLPLEPITV